ncbi:MAG: beta-galactosidase, partial [Verrucomicrobia bacterium]|nr:beta-galactosidase [Verrucomicrobiota bacterium]
MMPNTQKAILAAAVLALGALRATGAGTVTEYTHETPPGYRHRNGFYDNLPGGLFGPRIAWAEPYVLGNLKLLVLMPVTAAREAVELRSRIPADVSVITMSSHDFWHKAGAEPAYDLVPSEEALNETANRFLSGGFRYDAIIIGKVKWPAIPSVVRQKILDRVQAGAALVFISPWEVAEELQRTMALGGADNPLAQIVRQSVPVSLLPLDKDFEASSPKHFAPYRIGPMTIRAGKLGGGTVVFLDYQDRWMKNKAYILSLGGSPWGAYAGRIALTPFVPDDDLSYDYYFSILGKLLYAATGKTTGLQVKCQQPVVTVANHALPGAPASFVVSSSNKERPDAAFAYEVRDRTNQVLRKGKGVFTFKQGEAVISPDIPRLRQGTYIVDLWVLQNGSVLDWASAGMVVAGPPHIGRIEPAKDYFRRDEPIAGTVKWQQPPAAGLTPVIELWDTYDRLIQSVRPDAGGHFQFKTIRYPLSRTYRIVVKVMDKEFVSDQQERWVGLPSNAVDDYQFLFWGEYFQASAGTRASKALLPQCKRHGVTGYYDIAAWVPLELNIESADNLARNNLLAWPYCLGPWGFRICSPRAGDYQGTREEVLQDTQRNYTRFTEAYRRYGTMAYCIAEECFIDRKEGAWSNPAALKDYHLYLKERYGDIGKLNEVWQAKFKDFQEIDLISFAAAKTAQQSTRWLEQELHQVDRFNRVSEDICQTVQSRDPGAYVALDCQGGMDYDWPRMANIVHAFTQCSLESFNKEKGDRGGTWIGPYVGNSDEWTMRTVPWQYLFQGGTHVIWWSYGFTPDLCEPLLCFQQASEECRELESGPGKLLLESRKRIDPIAILWSNPSYYAGILNPGEISWEQSRLRFEDMLRHIGMDFRAVSEDAAQKELAFGDAQKVLLLPNCQSLGRATVERIKAFAKAGGLVIADYPPALVDEYLRPYGETKATGDIKFETCAKCKGEKRVEVGNVWQACPACGGTGQTMKGGVALTKSALDDLFDFNAKGAKAYGKGYGLYLKGSPDKREEWGGIRKVLAEKAGIAADIEVLDSLGNPRTDVRSYVFDNGRANFLGLLPERAQRDPPGLALTVKLQQPRHVYDVRHRQYLGETAVVQTGLLPTEAKLLAFLPERIEGLQVAIGRRIVKPGDTV